MNNENMKSKELLEQKLEIIKQEVRSDAAANTVQSTPTQSGYCGCGGK
jgi:hypothetical protein